MNDARIRKQVLPGNQFVSKFFLPADQSPEREMADLYFSRGPKFDYKRTRFYRLRTGKADWQTPGMGNLPDNLVASLRYYVLPWADKPRKQLSYFSRFKRRFRFKELLNDFFRLADSISARGFDNTFKPIKGYFFINGIGSERFVYTDGNRRIGILSSLGGKRHNHEDLFKIHVDVQEVFEENTLMKHPVIQANMGKYGFSEKDVWIWFNHLFSVR